MSQRRGPVGPGVPVLSVSLRVLKRRTMFVLGLILLAYVGASALYLRSFRLDREADTVIVAVQAEFRDEAERLAKAFAAETGKRVELLPPPASDPAAVLSTGAADCILADQDWGGRQSAAVPAPGCPTLYVPTLLSVRFPSPHTAVSLREAQAICRELAAGEPGPWPEAGLEAIGLADRSPARQLLAVEGVYPTLKSVLSGDYPLSSRLRLYVRRGPSGLFGLVGRLPFVRNRLQPNAGTLREFSRWLGTAGARAALYGTDREISLTAVGDVWFARNVGKVIDQNGTDYPFALVADRLRAADITWCDLESPLGVTGSPLPGKLIWFRARPETVQCLKSPGIDVVCLANNHILDYDSPCLLETLDTLEANGIAYCGAGRDAASARRPAVLEAGGLRVAFLAYTEYADSSLYWSHAYPRTFLAGENLPGCNPLDLDLVAEDIAGAKEVADLVVVGYHWGLEDRAYPEAYHPWNNLPEIARKTIDLGACLVLGTHPHHIQGFEVRDGGLIAYSLGNFVTDQIEDAQREGMILDVELGPSGVLSARITPVWSEGFRPTVLEGERARRVLEEVERISAVYRRQS